MDVRRVLLAALFSVVLTLPLAPPAQADLVGANIFDPVVNILPPRPVPYTPYTGSICPDGSPTCIDATIAEMQRRLDIDAAECDHDAIFGLAYLRVTQDVRKAVNSGWFSDRVWLGQVDAVFARLYFNSMDAWHAGERASIPKAWRIALQAADDKSVTGLGNFMLSMNAHINRDFSYVLAEVGLTAADGTSHKPDHNAYNQRLDSLYHPVFDEEAARFDPMFNKFDLGPVDELVVSTIMRGWREMVWRHAEALAATRGLPALRKIVQKEIEEYAATQALLIRTVFASSSPARRDAWCATHHG
jgi:hypothetical protein